ncbi:MAG: aminoacyl-tRNA deacylase [Ktedonobacteraceae bacterium]
MAKTKHNKIKTNAMRLLDAHDIVYTTFSYAGDTFHSADEVAGMLGIPLQQVFKTLVVLANGGRRLLIMIPADRELDLRQVARAVDAKSVHMAAQREAEQLTGLKVGGISPLALLDKHFEVYLDASTKQLDELYISGGQRGITLHLRVKDLIDLTKAKVIPAAPSAINAAGDSEGK